MTTEELKPCPACRSLKLTHIRNAKAEVAYVMCQECLVYGPCGDFDGSKWNSLPRRDDDQALKREVYSTLFVAWDSAPGRNEALAPLLEAMEDAGWDKQPEQGSVATTGINHTGKE